MDDAAGPGRIARLESAFRAGDLNALRNALHDPDAVPNGPMPSGIGPCLEYAIYHAPILLIRQLLELGADTNPQDHAGFPPLIAALHNATRRDTLEIVQLLLDHGADPDQRGINDYTPLHVATAEQNIPAVQLLLDAGADPSLATRIDDHETPLDVARRAGRTELVRLLEDAVPPGGAGSGNP